MPRYADMLAAGIDKTGKSLKQIVLDCEDLARQQGWMGKIQLDNTTLSRLKSGNQKPLEEPAPDDPMPSRNRLLAQVLGLPAKEFVLAGAVEHTPYPVLQHIAGDLLEAVHQLSESVKATQEAAKAALEEVEGWDALPPAALAACKSARTRIATESYKTTLGVAAISWLVVPYMEEHPKVDHDRLAAVLQEHAPFYRMSAVHTLGRALAEAAKIEYHPLFAFVRAMQEVNEVNSAVGSTGGMGDAGASEAAR